MVAALNRLGAVAVLMRPDGDIAREAELGQVDADHRRPRARAAGAPALGDVHDFVLGGGGGPRDLGSR